MSSAYRRICLSHDPAIVIDDDEFSSLDAALAANVVDTVHEHCDMVIGQYSCPLVRVFCIPGRGHQVGLYHSGPEGVDVAWLRLLWAAARRDGSPEVAAALKGLDTCWTVQRIRRLRHELGVDEATPCRTCRPSTSDPRSRRTVEPS